MARLKEMRLIGTTSAGGAVTINGGHLLGQLYAVRWVVGTFDAGVDAVLTMENAQFSISTTILTLTDANASAIYYPRLVVHSEAGAALTGTSGGDRELPLLDGVPKLVVAQGGNVKQGGAVLYYYLER